MSKNLSENANQEMVDENDLVDWEAWINPVPPPTSTITIKANINLKDE